MMASMMYAMASESPKPMRTCPLGESSPCPTVAAASSMRAMAAVAYSSSLRPASVSLACLASRTYSCAPNSSSSLNRWRERFGWLMHMTEAALVTEPSSTSFKKQRRSSNSIASPFRAGVFPKANASIVAHFRARSISGMRGRRGKRGGAACRNCAAACRPAFLPVAFGEPRSEGGGTPCLASRLAPMPPEAPRRGAANAAIRRPRLS